MLENETDDMMSLLSVGEHWEAVRAWSEGYGTFEGGRWDHSMIMMALLKIMMVVEVKEMMVLLSIICTLYKVLKVDIMKL